MTEWQKINRTRQMYVQKFTAFMQRSLKVQIAPIIEKLGSQRPEDVEVHLDKGPIRQVFVRLYADTGTGFARQVHRNLTGKSRKSDLEDVWMQDMMQYVDFALGNRIVSITGSSKEIAIRIMKNLAETRVIPEGLSIEETARIFQREFKAQYLQTTLARARVIAQTEVLTASNRGSNMGAMEAGATHKVWMTSGITDPEGHDRHVAYPGLDGQRVEISGYFDVGGYKARYPGDETLPASEVVNCKCAEVYE